jgi:hypothetical protein
MSVFSSEKRMIRPAEARSAGADSRRLLYRTMRKPPPSLYPAGFLVAVADRRFLVDAGRGDVPPVERQR